VAVLIFYDVSNRRVHLHIEIVYFCAKSLAFVIEVCCIICYAISWIIFFTNNWLRFGIYGIYVIKQIMQLSGTAD